MYDSSVRISLNGIRSGMIRPAEQNGDEHELPAISAAIISAIPWPEPEYIPTEYACRGCVKPCWNCLKTPWKLKMNGAEIVAVDCAAGQFQQGFTQPRQAYSVGMYRSDSAISQRYGARDCGNTLQVLMTEKMSVPRSKGLSTTKYSGILPDR
jgi:hypothetical protein